MPLAAAKILRRWPLLRISVRRRSRKSGSRGSPPLLQSHCVYLADGALIRAHGMQLWLEDLWGANCIQCLNGLIFHCLLPHSQLLLRLRLMHSNLQSFLWHLTPGVRDAVQGILYQCKGVRIARQALPELFQWLGAPLFGIRVRSHVEQTQDWVPGWRHHCWPPSTMNANLQGRKVNLPSSGPTLPDPPARDTQTLCCLCTRTQLLWS